MNKTGVRALICSVLLFVAVALLVYGSAFHCKEVFPQDPNDATVMHGSEFVLNQAVATGGLFRDAFGTLRVKPSESCPT